MTRELRDEVAGVLGADPARFWGVTIGVVPERVPEFWADVADALMPLLERREREAAERIEALTRWAVPTGYVTGLRTEDARRLGLPEATAVLRWSDVQAALCADAITSGAEVVAYSAHPEDDHLTIKVECRKCNTEWGWRIDTPTGNDRLEELADWHNIETHGHRRIQEIR